MIKGAKLPDNVLPAVKDIAAYIDSGKSGPALEFVSPVKGPSLEQICVAVGSGQMTAAKTQQQAALFQFSWPDNFQLIKNLRDVMAYGNNRMVLAMWNSTILTVGSVTLIVLFSALVAFVMQRRQDRLATVVAAIMLSGLIIPPAVVPTIFVL